jgi:hypothetical protein
LGFCRFGQNLLRGVFGVVRKARGSPFSCFTALYCDNFKDQIKNVPNTAKYFFLFTCTDTDDCVCASLLGGPGHFEKVKSAFVADAAANAIGRLSNGMPMNRQLVAVLDENVERSKMLK